MSLLIWPLQWVKEHPYQTAFWCLPIVLSIVFSVFGSDVRTFIGVKFASFKKKWLQVQYVTALRTLSLKALYFDHPEMLIVHILLATMLRAAYFGFFLFCASTTVFLLPFKDHVSELWLVSAFSGYMIAYLASLVSGKTFAMKAQAT
jgi:hypothetical protein